MATPVVNITIPQGTDFSEVFTSTESDGSASNLAGFTGASKVKKHPGATSSQSFTVSITGSTGEVSIAMTAGKTVALDPGRYYYDVVLTSGSGSVSRMVEGMAIVTAGITT
tara:strand:+ start:1057 stop:1389 length:333 start_codon:yes stop_codon:yes gene_type:complete